jgi:hypothetical protein
MSQEQDTILLVEDNPRDVLLLQRALRKANIANPLQIVNDGDAAVLYLSGQDSGTGGMREMKETRGRGDAGTRGRGDAGTRGRGDAGTRGRGDAGTRRNNQ